MHNSTHNKFYCSIANTAAILNAVAAIVIALLVGLINIDVLSRFLFTKPIRGVVELVALSIPAAVFLSLPFVKNQDKLIRADVLANRLARKTPQLSAALNWLFTFIGIGICTAIALASIPELLHSLRFDIHRGVEGEFTVPVWPLQFIIVVGSVLLMLFELSNLRSLTKSPLTLALLATFVALVFVIGYSVESRHLIGTLAISLMFILIYLGLPVAYALMAAAVLGISLIKGNLVVAVNTLGLITTGAIGEYVFAAVPLFVLLGIIVGAANIGRDALQSVHWVMGRLVGGLAMSTIVANAVFAAITGISIASAAIFSRIAAPPLIEQGYEPRFAVGLVAGSSVLGMLIPPSLLLIIYGLVAEVSINRLFTAAIIPGLILTMAFIVLVVLVAIIKPSFAVNKAFRSQFSNDVGAKQAISKAIPILILIAVTLGGIYGGVFTPTEAGAIGSLSAIIVSLIMGRLKPASLGKIFIDTAQSSAAILSLILGASAFAIMLTLSGIPSALGEWIAAIGVGLTAYALVYLVALIILGTILDSTSILLIMVPLAIPTIASLNGDLIWFGIVTVIGVEIGLLTPPLGLSVYTIKSSLEIDNISLADIFVGALPFVFIMLLVSIALIAFPILSLVLVQ